MGKIMKQVNHDKGEEEVRKKNAGEKVYYQAGWQLVKDENKRQRPGYQGNYAIKCSGHHKMTEEIVGCEWIINKVHGIV